MHRPRCLRRSREQALSAYWDEVILRAPTEPVPPRDIERGDAAIVRRLQTAPGQISPDASFADALLDSILTTHQGGRPMPATPSIPTRRPVAITTGLSVPRHGSQVLGPRPANRRWAGVTVAVVVAVAILALWTTSLRDADPARRRDTTAIAAAGTPVATMPAGDASPSSRAANQTVSGNGGNAILYTGVVDLSGSKDMLKVWLLELRPAEIVDPRASGIFLVMPIDGAVEERISETELQAGQAASLQSVTDGAWQLVNQTDTTVRVLIASEGDLAFTVATTDPADLRLWDLGNFPINPEFNAAILEVTRIIGVGSQTWIDTGGDGIAIILAEQSPTIVDVIAGDGTLRRFSPEAGLQPPDAGLEIAPADQQIETAHMATGDVLAISGGAAATIRGEAEGNLPILVVTLRFDSARLSVQGGVVSTMDPGFATMLASTPAAGCDVEPYPERELRSLLATPSVGSLPSVGFTLADGVPADDQVAAEIAAAADLLGDCARSGDALRYARLWDADGLRFVYSAENLEEDLRTASEAGAFTPDPAQIDVSIQDVRIHPDGRVSAVVDLEGEVAYVVWVKRDGAYLVELFNAAIFSGTLADGARCDTVPLDQVELAAITPATLTPAAVPAGDGPGGAPGPDGQMPGMDVASAGVARLFDCLSTRDPARIYALATDGFRAQWAGAAASIVPLGEAQANAETRLPIAVGTIYQVDVDETSGERRVGVLITGSIVAYVVFVEVDGEWLIDGWAPL